MKQIQEFSRNMKEFDKKLSKKSTYIRDSKIKLVLRDFYVEWKKNIIKKLKSINIDKNSVERLNIEFTKFYEFSKKDFFKKKELKSILRRVNQIFLDDVIIKIQTSSDELEAISSILDQYLLKIKNPEEKDFAEDAISCISIKKRKPAIIVGWVLVMYNLYIKINKEGFGKFNNVYAQKFGTRNPSFKRVKKLDDFEYFPDQDIIFSCEDLGILDRNERRILIDDCLKLRNMCSHPGKYNPGIKSTEVFFEKIIDIVLSKT
ncbi:MAG: hypothetical protein KJ771_02505 [Nanoarchaeota archaeon]|nr:hypothetical protein [Nanoarchaeota archaeon]